MKRRVFLLLLAVMLCITAAAFATELTWDQNCYHKTSAATMLYVQLPGDDFLTSTSMLPAGTYIRTTGQSLEGKTGISYSANNCDPLYGYIDGSVIVSATSSYTLSNGTVVYLPEALVRSRAALNIWLEMEYGETTDSATYTDENGVTHEIGNEAALEDQGVIDGNALYYKYINTATVQNGAYTPTVYTEDDGNHVAVQVVFMGLARSKIILNGEEQLVETWRLTWETEAPEDSVLAIVTPPKGQGTVKVHSEASSKSGIINRVDACRVVRVISTGKNWTLVDIDDNEDFTPRGYIATAYLELLPNIPVHYEPAKLSVLGNVSGGDTVWIRAEDKDNSAHIVEFYTGEPMSVYAQNDKWSEIDIGGYHAFVLSKFVTMDEPEETTAAASAPAE